MQVAQLVPWQVPRLRAAIAAGSQAPLGPLNAALCAMLEALAARDAGDADTCAVRAAAAAESFARIGWPDSEAACRELAGDPAGALEIYRRFGYVAEVRRLERPSLSGAGTLSPRERELAQLIAEGKNNREAAEALSISIKAVEKYLTSIYRKLGVASRTQLTGYLVAGRVEAASRS